MGVSCFNLNLLLEGNNFYSKVGKRDSSGLGWASTPPQVQYQLHSATAACHHPSIMTTDRNQPQRLNCPKSSPRVTLFFFMQYVSFYVRIITLTTAPTSLHRYSVVYSSHIVSSPNDVSSHSQTILAELPGQPGNLVNYQPSHQSSPACQPAHPPAQKHAWTGGGR
jgi:hypothetical protein